MAGLYEIQQGISSALKTHARKTTDPDGITPIVVHLASTASTLIDGDFETKWVMDAGAANRVVLQVIYFATDGTITTTYLNQDGTPYTLVGAAVPWGGALTGLDTDNAAITTNKPLLSGGKAVDVTAYTPAYTVGDSVTQAYNKDTGAALVHQANLDKDADTVTTFRGIATVRTYTACIVALVVEGTPTDIIVLNGSATEIVRLKKWVISGVASTAIVTPVRINKRSTADSGGTSAGVTSVPHNSTNAASTATVVSYTADPTVGTLVGPVAAALLALPVNTAANNNELVFEFGDNAEQEIALLNSNENLALSFGGATINAGIITSYVTYTVSAT